MPNQISELSFIHVFVPGSGNVKTTLLLLHGTGGNEQDLLELGAGLLPGAALLSPRGKILENGMPRFFRRLALGVFDLEDLKFRTEELAAFVQQASAHYKFDPVNVIAVGYSNGANIASSLLLRFPRLLAGAALLHPMLPFTPDEMPELTGVPVFISGGRRDPIIAPAQTEALVEVLSQAGATVTTQWMPGGHELHRDELREARQWLQRVSDAPNPSK